MRRWTWLGLIGLAFMTLSDGAEAQGLVPVRRNVLGFGAAFMQPTGEFERFVSWGGGGNMNFVADLDREGILGIRLDGSVLWYGHEHYDV